MWLPREPNWFGADLARRPRSAPGQRPHRLDHAGPPAPDINRFEVRISAPGVGWLERLGWRRWIPSRPPPRGRARGGRCPPTAPGRPPSRKSRPFSSAQRPHRAARRGQAAQAPSANRRSASQSCGLAGAGRLPVASAGRREPTAAPFGCRRSGGTAPARRRRRGTRPAGRAEPHADHPEGGEVDLGVAVVVEPEG